MGLQRGEASARKHLSNFFLKSIRAACFSGIDFKTAAGSIACITLNSELQIGSSLCKIMHAVVVALTVPT